jgi:hypothetical protein
MGTEGSRVMHSLQLSTDKTPCGLSLSANDYHFRMYMDFFMCAVRAVERRTDGGER